MPAETEPELTPFSLAELGLSPEEIAALDMDDQSEPSVADTTPAPVHDLSAEAEPEMTPFSLEELGLSPEEIAAMGMGEQAAPSEMQTSAEAEPEMTPFSLEELGLSPEEISAMDMSEQSESSLSDVDTTPVLPDDDDPGLTPFSFDDIDASDSDKPVAAPKTQRLDDLDADIQPFSLQDLGIDSMGMGGMGGMPAFDEESKLGLTDEELAGIGLGMIDEQLQPPGDNMVGGNNGDFALNKLMRLGEQQGFVDLTDIIDVVDDPVAEADRIEYIGRELHRAGIEIRDGDEVIGMDEFEEEGDYSEGDTYAFPDEEETESFAFDPARPAGAEWEIGPAQDTPPAETESEEVELRPFSFEELDLSPEEIAALEAAEQSGAAVPDTPLPMPEPADQPEPLKMPATPSTSELEAQMVPFSLEELGLSPEEIAALEMAEQESQTGESSSLSGSPTVHLPEDELKASVTPVSDDVLAGLVSDSDTEPAVDEPSAPDAEPEMTPFSLADLGLSAEEIAMLGAAAAAADSKSSAPAEGITASKSNISGDIDMFDFDVADQQKADIDVSPKPAPEPEPEPEPEQTVSPEDAAFVPATLDDLDDIWEGLETPMPEVKVARVVLDRRPADEPAPRREYDYNARRNRESAPRRETTRRDPARRERDYSARRDREPAPRRDARTRREPVVRRDTGRSAAPAVRGYREPAVAYRERALVRDAAPRRRREVIESQRDAYHGRSLSSFIPTGDDRLDAYVQQLEAEPDNYGLTLAIARVSMQIGQIELAILQYRNLIREGQSLEQIIDDLQTSIEETSDGGMLQRLHRLLGDVYFKQDRFADAVAEYSWTFR
ncbi:MAG: hypothetical protein HC837_14515 [Chloroflexaceae bacterium]|nr:hypothetical protein [Chloroflexaceae bacterium]